MLNVHKQINKRTRKKWVKMILIRMSDVDVILLMSYLESLSRAIFLFYFACEYLGSYLVENQQF